MTREIKKTIFKTTSGKTYIFHASRILSRDECIEHLRGIASSKTNLKLKKGETAIITLNI